MFATLVWKRTRGTVAAQLRDAIGAQARSDRALETGRYHLWACGDIIGASLLGPKSIAPGRPSCHSILATRPRISAPRQPKDRSTSMHGLAIVGRSCFSSEGLHAGVHDRARVHGRLETGVRQTQLQDYRPERRFGRRSRALGEDIRDTQGHAPNYPLIGDVDLRVAKLYDMLHPNASGTAKDRSPADNATVRSVFLIGPDKKIKAMLTYPMSTGRNFDEVLRLLDSIQLTAKFTVATPVNWKPGDEVIIPPSVSDEQAKARFPMVWRHRSRICATCRSRVSEARRADRNGKLPVRSDRVPRHLRRSPDRSGTQPDRPLAKLNKLRADSAPGGPM